MPTLEGNQVPPAAELLHAIAAWQQTLFGGYLSVDGEPELRDAEHNGTTMDNFAGEPAMLTGSQMQELISSSLQAAVDEVAMPTFPDRGSEEGGATASTMPWRPPLQFPNLVNGGTTATNLDVHTLLRAARILEPHVDAVDINFGCPTEDARRGGHQAHSPRCRRYGAYLLRDSQLVVRIVKTVAAGLRRIPVTAKIRLLQSREATLQLAMAIEQAGAAALCVHGRTITQRPKYAERDGLREEGLAPNWEAIADVRSSVGIPVIANGGIETKHDAAECLKQTGAAAVMSAEALLEDPALFDDSAETVQDRNADVARMLRLGREFLELAETFNCPLKYPPTKSHLFKILHRLIGADQATARRKEAAGLPLSKQEELKLELMRCPVSDFTSIRRALDVIEASYAQNSEPLGVSWYRRWRKAVLVG
eukprot:s4448_g5.t2